MDLLRPSSRTALDRLLRRAFPGLRRLAASVVGDADAEDVVQEACLRLLAVAPVVERPRRWLVRATLTGAIDRTRALRVRLGAGDGAGALETLADPAPTPESASAARQRLDRLSALLAGLPARQREALLLSRLEGLSYPAIAARLGVSARTVERDVVAAVESCLDGLAGSDPGGD